MTDREVKEAKNVSVLPKAGRQSIIVLDDADEGRTPSSAALNAAFLRPNPNIAALTRGGIMAPRGGKSNEGCTRANAA